MKFFKYFQLNPSFLYSTTIHPLKNLLIRAWVSKERKRNENINRHFCYIIVLTVIWNYNVGRIILNPRWLMIYRGTNKNAYKRLKEPNLLEFCWGGGVNFLMSSWLEVYDSWHLCVCSYRKTFFYMSTERRGYCHFQA